MGINQFGDGMFSEIIEASTKGIVIESSTSELVIYRWLYIVY